MTEDVAVLQAMVHDLTREYPERPILLDHFAGLALQGIVANDNYLNRASGTVSGNGWGLAVVRDAYALAEQMLQERAKRLTKEPTP